ncbi:MAG: hypothetical protein JMDDDDMK_02581 [Acidobacteria bacterium]|nr:hypothetical protein [Acidobacteriota bacterium]
MDSLMDAAHLDQKREAEERLEALLLEGLDSGPAKPLTKADLDGTGRVTRKRVSQKTKKDGWLSAC